MGNSIQGQAPSETWLLIADQMNNRTNIVYNNKIMMEISKKEIDWFNVSIEILKYQKNNSPTSYTELLKMFDLEEKEMELLNQLYNYTLNEKYNPNKIYDINDGDNEYAKDEQSTLNNQSEIVLHCDIKLLDYVYGKKQCEYAINLMEKVEGKLSSILEEQNSVECENKGSILNKQNLMNLMKEIYENDCLEMGNLATKLINETIVEVNPCEHAFNIWQSWSII